MTDLTPHAIKSIDLAGFSNFTLEDLDWVDGELGDGRVSRVHSQEAHAGGMIYYGARGVRLLDPSARVAVMGLVGQHDEQIAWQAVDELGSWPHHLIPVAGKYTNRARVLLSPNGERLIERMRNDIRDTDLTKEARDNLLRTAASSRAMVLRSNDVAESRRLLETLRQCGTYTALCPSDLQREHLGELEPDAAFVNLQEAAGNGHPHGSASGVFQRFVKGVAARHLVVMTTGPGPVYVFDRSQSQQIVVPPVALPESNGFLWSVGCGDVFAGVMTYLMGQAERPVSGKLIRATVRLAQTAVGVHMTGNAEARERLQRLYHQLRKLFAPHAVTKSA